MAEKKNVKRKKRIRIDYPKAVRSICVLVLIIWMAVLLISPLLGIGTGYNRDLIRESGNTEAAAPKIKASSAVMYSIDLDKPVYEKKADKKRAPYSMTKMLTCYLALENLPEDKIVKVSANASRSLPDGTTIYLKEGEKMSVLDLVYGAMLESGNDAATALGEAVSGDIRTFSELMNKTVEKWGCENTHFVNANGWDDDDHYSTAADMAVIAKNCLENEKLKKISVTKRYTIPATNMTGERKLKNALLKSVKNLKQLTGGKTGSWSTDDCGVALGFFDKGLDSIIVLMGDTETGRAKDPKKLVEFAHDVTPGFLVTEKGDAVCEAWVKHGAENRVPLTVKATRYAYPKNGKKRNIKVETELEKLTAPIAKGDKAGRFYVYADKKLVGEGNLYAAEDVKQGWILSNLYISNSMTVMLVLFMLLSSVLVIVLKKVFRDKRTYVRNARH